MSDAVASLGNRQLSNMIDISDRYFPSVLILILWLFIVKKKYNWLLHIPYCYFEDYFIYFKLKLKKILEYFRENGNRRGPYKDDAGSGEPVVSENPALPSIVSSITQYLPKLHNLLINPPKVII